MNDESTLSEKLRETVKKTIADHNLTDDDIYRITSGIRKFYCDGTVEPHTLTNFDFIDEIISNSFSSDGFPITLPIMDDEFSTYIPMDSIALVEFPLLKANEAFSRLNLEDSEES